MWLIDTTTFELKLFFTEAAPRYAILSHRWEDEEITFQEMNSNEHDIQKKGYQKVIRFCEVARADGYEYGWADTCCIDKTSSAELSEAINSMFMWYQNSDICYAYLSDVPELCSVRDPNRMGVFDVKRIFQQSAWFTRGWTLQELIAPSIVEFYSANWESIGTKEILKKEIAEITGIRPSALLGANLSTFNIAERMSWASSRQTTRLEDKAYALLGVFQVNMPLLYGEGNRAFHRLQEEILKAYEDYTIFVWPGAVDLNVAPIRGQNSRDFKSSLFAYDPSRFRRLELSSWQYSDLERIPSDELDHNVPKLEQYARELQGFESDDGPPTFTGRGLRICLPLMHVRDHEYLASTYYRLRRTGEWVCIPIIRSPEGTQQFARDTRFTSRIRFLRSGTGFKRCLIYGERDGNTSSRVRLSSNLHKKAGHLVSAGKYQQAIKLAERLYHPTNPDIFKLKCNVMKGYTSHKRYKDAELFGLDLVKDSRAKLGETHEHTLSARLYYAVATSKQGHWNAAEEIFQDLTMRYDQLLIYIHPTTLLCWARRAENLFNIDPRRGRECIQKAMNMFEGYFKNDRLDRPLIEEFVRLFASMQRPGIDYSTLSVLLAGSPTKFTLMNERENGQ